MVVDREYIKVKLDQKRKDAYGELFDTFVEKGKLKADGTGTKFLDKAVYYARKYFRVKEKMDEQHKRMWE